MLTKRPGSGVVACAGAAKLQSEPTCGKSRCSFGVSPRDAFRITLLKRAEVRCAAAPKRSNHVARF